MACIVKEVRKKSVVVQAAQWDGTEVCATAIIAWAGSSGEILRHAGARVLAVDTLEGTMAASPGSWIIRGLKGEFYPIADDIYQATYEEVGVHDYISTACHHASDPAIPPVRAAWLHARCRLECKWCVARCRCACHEGLAA